MRNIFDQYSQPENRLTHALAVCLDEDRRLLGQFVFWVTGKKAPKSSKLEIVEQQLPGESPLEEAEAGERGLPDAWIHDNDEWSLLIESKVAAKLKNDQLHRHIQTAKRRGFSTISLLVIDTVEPKRRLPAGTHFRKWSEIYEWLHRHSSNSEWAKRTLRYLEVAEARWISDNYLQEGALTKFAGIPFDGDNPYSYLEAKRLIRLMMDELRKRKDLQKQLGMDPAGEGRGMITGKSASSVWDFLRLKDFQGESKFIRMLHLTASIQSERLVVILTVPNGLPASYRKRLTEEGYEEFEKVFRKVHTNLRKAIGKVKGAASWVEVLQRHYRVQSAPPTIDARLTFTLDTAFASAKSPVKYQPLWLESAYNLLDNKKGNMQLGIGAIFPYATCPSVHDASILEHVAHTWISCKPIVDKILAK